MEIKLDRKEMKNFYKDMPDLRIPKQFSKPFHKDKEGIHLENKFKKEKSKLADKKELNNININLKLKYDAIKQLCPYEELNRRCGGIFVGLDRTREIKRNKLINKLKSLKKEKEDKIV
ncbi:hypothetical protein HHI36_016827 [Cryptolaemus montrouzieri]|uniref:Uncharacterized protein n=1 Tax=Cryptolaemus montrouzieri TaxID=559131 RepID=A0ABD2NLA6_9CUCU